MNHDSVHVRVFITTLVHCIHSFVLLVIKIKSKMGKMKSKMGSNFEQKEKQNRQEKKQLCQGLPKN